MKKQDTRTDDSTYDSQYPYNKVWESPSGHVIHHDDTPGAERYFHRHPSGTYTEISADGKIINFNVGDSKTYNKAGVSITIDENGDIKISGHSRFVVGGGLHGEIAGEAGIFVGGDLALAGMGNVNMRAKGLYFGSDGSLNINCGGNINIVSGGNIKINGKRIDLNS